MDLPSFDLLWETSDKLNELEVVLNELDKSTCTVTGKKRRRHKYRGGLYGVGFDIEDRTHYEPLKYCCDEAFYTVVEFDRHVQLHTKCPVASCSFVAYPKLMRMHEEVVHAGGLYESVYRVSSDKAVGEWREARRSNYPTLERIQAKQETVERRIQRGEIFETKQFGTLQRNRSTLTRPVKVAKTLDADASSTSGAAVHSTIVTEVEDAMPRLVPHDYDSDSGCNASSSVGFHISDDETEVSSLPAQGTGDSSLSTARRGRRRRGGRRRTAGRRRGADNAAEEAETLPNGAEEDIGEESQNQATANNGDALTDQNDSVLIKPAKSDPFSSHPVVQMAAKRRALTKDGNRIYSRPTLLHMLLAPDIRKERNQLMQCIRYVIQHNFFLEKTVSEDAC